VGVPLNVPLHVSNDAQLGLFAILKTSGSPSASRAVGLKEYALAIVAVPEGEPEIVGATLDLDVARSEKAGSDFLLTPSLTLMAIPFHKPTVLGVPESMPVAVLKLAHEGLLAMVKVSVVRSGSAAVGRKLYCEPTNTQVPGVPEIVGARFVAANVLLTFSANKETASFATWRALSDFNCIADSDKRITSNGRSAAPMSGKGSKRVEDACSASRYHFTQGGYLRQPRYPWRDARPRTGGFASLSLESYALV
jgi:hypothetical protein